MDAEWLSLEQGREPITRKHNNDAVTGKGGGVGGGGAGAPMTDG